jgi:hypothetical protein
VVDAIRRVRVWNAACRRGHIPLVVHRGRSSLAEDSELHRRRMLWTTARAGPPICMTRQLHAPGVQAVIVLVWLYGSSAPWPLGGATDRRHMAPCRRVCMSIEQMRVCHSGARPNQGLESRRDSVKDGRHCRWCCCRACVAGRFPRWESVSVSVTAVPMWCHTSKAGKYIHHVKC